MKCVCVSDAGVLSTGRIGGTGRLYLKFGLVNFPRKVECALRILKVSKFTALCGDEQRTIEACKPPIAERRRIQRENRAGKVQAEWWRSH